MSSAWLDPVRVALAGRRAPLPVVIRDDDGGWDDALLERIVSTVGESGFQLDLAVIPAAVTPALGATLRRWRAAGVGVHQHGLRHVSHEVVGRRCEFGAARDGSTQMADLSEGQTLLAEALGEAPDSVFTPPWNRCTHETASCLRELGIAVLSREHRAAPFGVLGLAEIPVNVDWPRDGRRPGRAITSAEVAAAIEGEPYLGLMLHHAAMDDGDRGDLTALLDLLAQDPCVRPMRLLDCAPERVLS